ncbi:cation:proton antiporter domain-containing protein [Halomarina ordinaria]|uniref:Cation:proton antiporter n=1 Tax=Halomarina ordinaria TaxID=3033939 RepID=A0ABD5U746_9EURY|nr:cation:proton antiporter [Halomarina sp. PSRA2]
MTDLPLPGSPAALVARAEAPSTALQTVVDPLGHHELLVVIVQLTLLLFVARALGIAFSRVGQPAVVGELLAGVVLGPSLFGVLLPGVYDAVFAVPESQFHLLEVISWVGLIMLLIVTGLETDVDLILRKGRVAVVLSLGGILLPFATGFALGWYLPSEFIASADQRLVFSLFIATAMSISAIPVIAKILIDLDIVRRDFGQLILAAGMVDDTIGWILLATVAGLAQSGTVDAASALRTVVSVVVFLVVAFTLGRRAVDGLVRWVDDVVGGETTMITLLVVLALAAGAVTQYLGLEAILGAFVVGILVGQVNRFDYQLRHLFEVVTLGIFAPVFFAIAGLRMDVAALLDPTVLLVGLVVLAVACVGKFGGVFVAGRAVGLSNWEAIGIGGGMNARGAMEIIVATIGLGLGILTTEMYSIIVMVALVTSLMAPAVIRWALPHIEVGEAERTRLEAEDEARRGFVGGLSRVLLPTRCSVESQFAARLLGDLVAGREVEVTTMYVSEGDDAGASTWTLDSLRGRVGRRAGRAVPSSPEDGEDHGSTASRCLDRMRSRIAATGESTVRGIVRAGGDDATRAVLDEARRGYDLLVLGTGTPGRRPDEPLFTDAVDTIIRDSPCPFLVVRSDHERFGDGEGVRDYPVERILLPTTGTTHNRRAAEAAFAVARARDAVVEVVNVVDPPRTTDVFATRPDVTPAMDLGADLVENEAAVGRRMGARVETRVVVADGDTDPEATVVSLAADTGADLVFLGSSVRNVTQRAFLGHRVDYILEEAPCPVAVVGSS